MKLYFLLIVVLMLSFVGAGIQGAIGIDLNVDKPTFKNLNSSQIYWLESPSGTVTPKDDEANLLIGGWARFFGGILSEDEAMFVDTLNLQIKDAEETPVIDVGDTSLNDDNGVLSYDWRLRAFYADNGIEQIFNHNTVGLADFGDSKIFTTGNITSDNMTTNQVFTQNLTAKETNLENTNVSGVLNVNPTQDWALGKRHGLTASGYDDESSNFVSLGIWETISGSAYLDLTKSNNIMYIFAGGTWSAFINSGGISYNDDRYMQLGAGGDVATFGWSTVQTNNAFVLGLDDYVPFGASRTMIIGDNTDMRTSAYDYQHPIQPTPTVFIQSQNRVLDEWGSFAYDNKTQSFMFNSSQKNTTFIGNLKVLDGNFSLIGDARVTKEVVFKASNSIKGASAPSDSLRVVGESGNILMPTVQFSKVTEQEIYGEFHLPDDIDNTEDVEFHLMWIPGESWTTGNYNWTLEYLVKEEEANMSLGTPTTIYMDVTPDNAFDMIETKFTDTINADAQQIVFAHFYRDVATDNADDVGEVVFFEVEYVSDKLGEAI